MSDPLGRFRQWLAEVRQGGSFADAACLSTIGLDGWPNARFVALKEVAAEGFVVSGPLDSRKGRELERVPRAALTFWWPDVLRQVRIQGEARPIPAEMADGIFAGRHRDAQLLAWASRQGQPLASLDGLAADLEEYDARFGHEPVPRPSNWGGYCITPIRVEFLSFREDRMHERIEYYLQGSEWLVRRLQP